MKRVDAADLAEEVPGCLGVELVLGERIFAGPELELALVHLDHECVPFAADRTVAHGEFREVSFDLEVDRAAMTSAFVLLKRTTTHGCSKRGLTFEFSGCRRQSAGMMG